VGCPEGEGGSSFGRLLLSRGRCTRCIRYDFTTFLLRFYCGLDCLPKSRCPLDAPLRSKNVVQAAGNRGKLRTNGEQKGEEQVAGFCHKLRFFSGLRRLRQASVNLISRFEATQYNTLSAASGVAYEEARHLSRS
jgi:hypothetical protein